MRRTFLISTALLVSSLALSGCVASGSTSSNPTVQPGASAPLVQQADGSKNSTSGGSVVANADRQVVQTGYVTVVVPKPLDATDDAVRITEQAGGRVDGRNEYAPTAGNQGSATLMLRIPVAALDATLDKLKALGTVQEVSLSSTDVTMQSQDLDARIKALQASVDRLVALLATATNTDTLISLETAISDRQGELESLQSQQRYLADQVAMSTVTLNLISPDQAVVAEPHDFLSGLQVGWAAFLAFFAWLVVAVGVLLPWLVLAAAVIILIVVLVRRTRRRDEARAAAATAAAAPAKPARKAPTKK